jgi:hypothetical protein
LSFDKLWHILKYLMKSRPDMLKTFMFWWNMVFFKEIPRFITKDH